MTSSERNLLERVGTALWERKHPEWLNPSDGRIMPTFHLSPRTAPRYLADRVKVKLGARGDAPPPWITEDALRFLDRWLSPTDRGLEFGAGGTTSFFAERVHHVYSVEGFDHWYAPLVQRLEEQGIDNVTLFLASSEQLGYESEEHRQAYVGAHPELDPGSLDFVFVDGEYRHDCALRAIELLRPGGLLIIDNAEIYLPSTTRSPWQMSAPATPGWERWVELTSDWRSVWTTNGVWDTAFWIKP